MFRALLDAAGPTGSIQVAFRIFPEHVEVDVLHSDSRSSSPALRRPGRNGPAGHASGVPRLASHRRPLSRPTPAAAATR